MNCEEVLLPTDCVGVLPPYAVVLPKANAHDVGAPFGVTIPVSVAELVVTFAAGPVDTDGLGQYCGVDGEQTLAADADDAASKKIEATMTAAAALDRSFCMACPPEFSKSAKHIPFNRLRCTLIRVVLPAF
jgi:hypothetical protein